MATAVEDLPSHVGSAEARVAEECCRRLAKFSNSASTELRIQSVGVPEEAVELPSSVIHVLSEVLQQMSKGKTVRLVPIDEELSTQQAAELLHVSRQFLVERLMNGDIPFRQIGAQRCVRLQDVMAYKQRLDTQRLQSLSELTAIDQELGLGY